MRRFDIALLILSLFVLTAATYPSPPERPHCVVEVVGQASDGQLELSSRGCFATFDAAMRAFGVESSTAITPDGVATQVDGVVLPEATYILAVHYNFTNYQGTSFSVTASSPNCTGGYINFRTHYTSWNDKFESLIYGCDGGAITHWAIAPPSGGACSGAQLDAYTNKSTLGAMNNATSCVVYG